MPAPFLHSRQMPLAMASAGSKVRLVAVDGGQALNNRLAAMGLVPGTEVEVLRNSLDGPFILGVRGTQLILGRGMAHKIWVC
jgi:ferrous iron transport protein A